MHRAALYSIKGTMSWDFKKMLYTARRPSTDIFIGGGGGCISILAYANSANGGKCKIKVQDLFIRLSAVLVSAELIFLG